MTTKYETTPQAMDGSLRCDSEFIQGIRASSDAISVVNAAYFSYRTIAANSDLRAGRSLANEWA